MEILNGKKYGLIDGMIKLNNSQSNTEIALMNGIKSQRPQRSDRFWFYDGTVLVSLTPLVYKVHKSILDRHSSESTPWLVLDVEDPAALALSGLFDYAGIPVIVIPSGMGISVEDFEALLAHLYHDS